MSDTVRRAFYSHVAPTSPEPIGLEVSRALGAYVWDQEGKRYLDLLSGIGVANIGHTHPRVVEAVEKQIQLHHHVMVYGEYIQESQAMYAAELAAAAPGEIDTVYFANSGTEAVEGALKLARKATARGALVSFEGAYHGDTFGALSLNSNETYRKDFEPLLGPVDTLKFNQIGDLDRIDESAAAVVIEPVQGEGGVRIPSKEFMDCLRAKCDAVGALLIADEVMTGFGRTGKFWACEHWSCVPDILVSAKALGGGFPLGAFMAPRKLMTSLSHDPPLSHVTTFGGHPVSCAAGRAGLAAMQDGDLVARSAEVGEWWLERLRAALEPLESVREVRGLGMLFGVECTSAAAALTATQRAKEKGMLLGWTLHHDHILRLLPPLVTERQDLEWALNNLTECLA